jgi:hypothetical protein
LKGEIVVRSIKNSLRSIFNFFGAVLLSKVIYEKLLYQRNALFNTLISNSTGHLRAGTVCIIFSKDRPMQLYGLLDSYLKHVANPVPVTVIYSCKDKKHKNAYLEVMKYFNKVKLDIDFIYEEKTFKQTLLKALSQVRKNKILFLVDDIIFIKSVDLNIFKKINTQTHILSLRHSPFLKKSFTTNTRHSPPSFKQLSYSDDLLEFDWFESGGEWSDPWSLDGHLLNTSELIAISNCSNYKAPNSYEISLKAFNDIVINRKGLCFNQSKILNLPINRVQNEVNNISGNISVDFLLDKWNQGYCIDTSVFREYVPLSTHEDHPVKFIKRVDA